MLVIRRQAGFIDAGAAAFEKAVDDANRLGCRTACPRDRAGPGAGCHDGVTLDASSV
jgi:hypothetical protein